MHIIYITGEITDATVDKFINEYNNCQFKDLVIYINSQGGDIAHANVIINIINNSIFDITLIGVGMLFSAAFDIFFLTKCAHKYTLPDTIGMAHFSWSTFQLDESGKPHAEYDKFMMAGMKKTKVTTLQTYTDLGMTPAEVATINKSKDCYFTNIRLQELIEYGKETDS